MRVTDESVALKRSERAVLPALAEDVGVVACDPMAGEDRRFEFFGLERCPVKLDQILGVLRPQRCEP